MSLVANGNSTGIDGEPVTNNGFWPDIDPAHVRDVERLGTEITTPRLRAAIETAVASVNRILATFETAAQDTAIDQAADLPRRTWHAPGHYPRLYRRAVYATAHATLIERYYDYSATNNRAAETDANIEAADAYRRDASWAIAEILDRPHATVELI